MPAYKDYYEILGVPRGASAEEIKKAYRKAAREHHPDLASGKSEAERESAERRFKEINEAHQVLGDPKARSRYDALGSGWRHGEPFTGAGGQGPFTWAWGPHGGGGGGGAPPGGAEGFSDFFRSIFGGGGPSPFAGAGGGGRRSSFSGRGADVESTVDVSLREVLEGGARKFRLSGGSGGERTVRVRIPPGVREGGTLRIRGKGAEGPGGPGDLLLRVRISPDPLFRRKGNDLEVTVGLWPWEAVLGAEIAVPVLGGQVKMRVPPGARAGTRMKLRGKGLPGGDGARGDQYAVLELRVPEEIGEEERALYQRLAALHAERVTDGAPDAVDEPTS